jgi:hypothetical protein
MRMRTAFAGTLNRALPMVMGSRSGSSGDVWRQVGH